jgi:hypothetical protein
MTEVGTDDKKGELTAHDVQAIVFPWDQSQGFGRNDALAGYVLYCPMERSQSVDKMVELIESAQAYIYTGGEDAGIGHESNELAIDRLLALAADIPTAVPEDEQLRAWCHLLDADYVHMYAHHSSLESVLGKMKSTQPKFTDQIYKLMADVVEKKCDLFDANVGFSDEVARPSTDNFDFEAAMDGYSKLRETHPETLPLYTSIIILSSRISYEKDMPSIR